jgi:hypothetical protein
MGVDNSVVLIGLCFRLASGALEFVRPFPGGMEGAEYFNHFVAYSIGNDIRGARDYQFACTRYSPRPTHGRMLAESIDRLGNFLYDSTCCCGTVPSDIVGFGIEIGESFAQPPNVHCVSIS